MYALLLDGDAQGVFLFVRPVNNSSDQVQNLKE
jgi:hypothetical protein